MDTRNTRRGDRRRVSAKRFPCHTRLADRRRRRLLLEPLEQRTLLDGSGVISGTVFDDLDRDAVHDAGEPGLPGWTVQLQHGGGAGDLQQTFFNPAASGNEYFGYSVAAVGGDVLVGAIYASAGGTNGGAAFLLSGATGQLLQTFASPAPTLGDYFGWSVAAVGDKVLVGAPQDDTAAVDAGAAFLFDADTGELLHTFLDPAPAPGDQFGVSVAGVGDRVLVGAPGNGAGAAYLFRADTGELLQTFQNPTPAHNDQFGWSVAALGDDVLIGARLDDTGAADAGSAYLFDAATGELLQTFQKPDPADDDRLGVSVAAVGGNVLVGSQYDDTAATDAGAAYLFDAATGALLQTFLSPAPLANDRFGISVAGVEGNVLVGSYLDDTGAVNAGAAYLFDAATGELLQTYENPTPAGGDQFGQAVAALGGNVLIGAYKDDTAAGNSGAVYLFGGVHASSTAVTNAEGDYRFEGLNPGTYVVGETLQPDYFPTLPGGDGTYQVVIAGDEEVSDRDFGNYQNDVPAAHDDDYAVDEDQTLVVPAPGVLGNDADWDPLTASLTSHPSHGVLNFHADGSFDYAPEADFHGADSFTYRAGDGHEQSTPATVTITVRPVNDAPQAGGDTYRMRTGATLSAPAPGVLQNDTDADEDPLSAVLVRDVSHGTLALGSDGSFTYTPGDLFVGTDSFTYVAHDGVDGSNVATVTIEVGRESLGGTVFEDRNRDGVRDQGEPGLPDWTIELQRTGSGLLAMLQDPLPEANDYFGASVAAVGSGVLIGAYRDDTGALDAGAAYLFDPATGALRQSFQKPTPAAGDWFGYSVAAAGDNVLVGAYRDDTGAPDAGAAYLFDAADGRLLQTFLNPTPEANDWFGYSVAGTDDRVLIGAWRDGANGPMAGAAYLFDATSGELLHTLLGPAPQSDAQFGYAVATVGDDLLIGARYDGASGQAGTAYLFDGATGSLQQTFQNPSPAAGDYFGESLAAVGENVLIGAPRDDTAAVDAGAAYLFDAGTGELLQTFLDPAPAADDRFGSSVAGVAGRVLIGVPNDDSGGSNAGAACLFDAATGALLQAYQKPTPAAGDQFGGSIAMVGGHVLVGVKYDDAGADNAGAAYLFEGVYEPVTAVTEADGGYHFDELPPGSFRIRQVLPAGYYQTSPGGDGTYSVTLAAGENITGLDFGNYREDVPVAYDDQYAVDEDEALSVPAPGVLKNDVDGDPLTASLRSGPLHGGVTLRPDGSFDYTPPPDFHGTDAFVYQAGDGANDSNPATVTITVRPVNDPPVATGEGYRMAENTTLSAPAPGLLENDEDIDGDSLSAVLVDDVQHGTLTLRADGSFTYTPDAGFNEDDRFTYVVNDGTEDSDPVTVGIVVTLDLFRGMVFDDLDGNGVCDPGEPGLAGCTVELQSAEGGGQLVHTFLNPTPVDNDRFGRPVVAVGDNVLIGANRDDTLVHNAGAAYLFDGETGDLLRAFLNPSPDDGDWFGYAAAAVGDGRVVIGAYQDDAGDHDSGIAYLFDVQTGALLQTFVNPTPGEDDEFGYAVAALGDNVLIGAALDDTPITDSGAVYLFDSQTGGLLQTFFNPTPADNDRFGRAIAASGNRVLIGAYYDDTGANNAGAAYLFDAATGELLRTFFAPTPNGWDEFGNDVALVGDRVLIAAHRDDTAIHNAGAVYLFDANTGALLRTFFNPEPGDDDRFGRSIAVAGENLLVGANWDDTGAIDAGAAYLFDMATGELRQTFPNPTPDLEDEFGHSVCCLGDRVVIGARFDGVAGENLGAGAAYLFDTVGETFTTTTGTDGRFAFTDVPEGTYYVRQVLPLGYIQALPDDAYLVEVEPEGYVDDLDFANRRIAVVDRHVFYNNSAFDGNDPAADARDDDAIAPDKTALLPGQTATFANYTNCAMGINGLMIDVTNLGLLSRTPTAADFELKIGNTNDPTTWADAPSPNSITVRPGAGTGGSDRVTLIWENRAITKQWLQVTVLATPDTGLAADDVFYFGNAVAEAGNSTDDARVNATDMLLARNNPRTFLDPAPVDFPYDFNRDGRVNATDVLLARNNQTHFLSALRLITVPTPGAGEATKKLQPMASFDPDWMYELATLAARGRTRRDSAQAAEELFWTDCWP
ncbi:MAG: tandem-95 repeat protein [Pirellulales bacterium]|nr:tandem-95 repeat protein [Pirellulales bacterium]